MTTVASRDLPGVLGHELRNPLASAVTTLALLGELVDTGDPRRAMVDRALVDLDRMTNLIDGWLELSRSGRASTAPVAVDELLLSVADRHGAEIVSTRVGVTIDGNRELLARALDNLLENARRAGARKLRLAAQTLRNEVSIYVEDDGSGIDSADLPHLFEAGWSRSGGNGLGLHAVAATIEGHGGRIECTRLRHGTRFTLRLPANCHAASMA